MSQLSAKSRFKIFASFLALTLFFACAKDEPTKTEEEQPPTPPQADYFIIDFNVFPDSTSPAPFQKEQQILTYQNWGFAAVNVAVWNSLITLTLIAPVATFNSTIQEEPVLQPDGRWLWTKNFNVLGVPHTSKLYGETVTSGAEWEMYLSKENAFTDFKWYTGFSNLPLTEGNWTLFKDPDSSVEFIRIDWHRNQQGGDIKYTNIIPGHQDNGGYIYFEKNDASSPYDRFYDIYNKSMDNLTQIEWDSVTREGRVLDALHFGNPDWHCWDMDLMDIVCP
jgi:hypothetical protein